MNVLSSPARHLRCTRNIRLAIGSVPAARPLTRGLQTESGDFRTSALKELEKSGVDPNLVRDLAKSSPATISSVMAAPEIQLSKIRYARPVPDTPSYFTRSPDFDDNHVKVLSLLRKYEHLPTVPSSQLRRIPWKKIDDFKGGSGEKLKAAQFGRGLAIAKRLWTIHPKVMPEEVLKAVEFWARDMNPFSGEPKVIPIDRFGRAVGTGKRKEATARAFLVEGTGEVLVNGKPLTEAFGRIHDRESAMWAMFATNRMDKYNVWAIVRGGGPTGQAEAMTLAVAKALMAHEPALKPALRRAGCITRDPREVERKKAGHLKARKKPAWVKR